jgi:hypothetical protein
MRAELTSGGSSAKSMSFPPIGYPAAKASAAW